MKLNDPERFEREMRGDFSEIDRYLRRQRVQLVIVLLLGIAGLIALAYFS